MILINPDSDNRYFTDRDDWTENYYENELTSQDKYKGKNPLKDEKRPQFFRLSREEERSSKDKIKGKGGTDRNRTSEQTQKQTMERTHEQTEEQTQ